MKMTKAQFRKKVEKAAVLSGQVIDRHLPDALYEEMINEDDRDILLALKDIAYSTEKLSLGNIFKNIMSHKGNRLETEGATFRKREQAEIQAFIANTEMPAEVKAFIRKFKGR